MSALGTRTFCYLSRRGIAAGLTLNRFIIVTHLSVQKKLEKPDKSMFDVLLCGYINLPISKPASEHSLGRYRANVLYLSLSERCMDLLELTRSSLAAQIFYSSKINVQSTPVCALGEWFAVQIDPALLGNYTAPAFLKQEA